MKIGILTLPLYYNYGGILQAFALQTYLARAGHEVWVIDRRKKAPGRLLRLLIGAKRAAKKYLLRRPTPPVSYSYEREVAAPLRRVSRHTLPFVERMLVPRTLPITRRKEMKQLAKEHFDAFIVGSDQVWRPAYAPYLPDYFFEFLPARFKGRRIAYAASFGVDAWSLAEKPTRRLAALLARFDAVGVRERSGIALCEHHFGKQAVEVLDPTLLLTPADYLELLSVAEAASRPEGMPAMGKNTPETAATQTPAAAGSLARKPEAGARRLWVYVLDLTADKQAAVDRVAAALDLVPSYHQGAVVKEGKVAAPVTEWLAGLRDADFVFTDSFHGTAFSILFNKPFFVYANPARGTARFSSLLDLFCLQERLIRASDELTGALLAAPIDWPAVDRRLQGKRDEARAFLTEALGEASGGPAISRESR